MICSTIDLKAICFQNSNAFHIIPLHSCPQIHRMPLAEQAHGHTGKAMMTPWFPDPVADLTMIRRNHANACRAKTDKLMHRTILQTRSHKQTARFIGHRKVKQIPHNVFILFLYPAQSNGFCLFHCQHFPILHPNTAANASHMQILL